VPPIPGPHDLLILQDGEKVFRAPDDTGDSWNVPATMRDLWVQDELRPPVVVAIAATENRAGEYMPEEAVTGPGAEAFLAAHENRVYVPRSRAYVSFIIDELVPYVRSQYPVRTGSRSTAIGGSSRGALFSIYALSLYPELFFGAACLSTHWPHGDGLVVRWLRSALPHAGAHRIYFDYGDQGLDADYRPYQDEVDAIMRERGYRYDIDWCTHFYPGDGHSETYWARRLKEPIRFLFGTRKDDGA
jgi:enterochelin esterase-like enzyme